MRNRKGSVGEDDPRSFTSWKLDVLNAACADSRMTASQFRMFARVLKGMNKDTRVAILGDDVLADEVPGFKAQSSAFRARKAIAAAGYWTYEEGSGRRATRYTISDARVNAVEDELLVKREARGEKRTERRAETKRGQRTLARLHGLAAQNPCDPASETLASSQAVHLTGTPSELSHTVQDMALEGTDQEPSPMIRCAECGDAAVYRDMSPDPGYEIESCYCERHSWLANDPHPIAR